MLHQRENSVSFKAGALSAGMHIALLITLLISFNWRTTSSTHVSAVELWDSLPATAPSKPQPIPKLPPEAVKDPQPLEPNPVVKQAVELETAPQAEIVIKKKIEKTVKEKSAEITKMHALAALQKELMQEAVKQPTKPEHHDALKQLQQEALSEDKAIGDQKKLAANAGEIESFTNKIKAKIRGNVNKTLCGDGNPELKFEIGLLPTGDLSTQPKLLKSSGNSACDDAVERAIIASEPLPLPADATLFVQFRSLKLTFKPNDS